MRLGHSHMSQDGGVTRVSLGRPRSLFHRLTESPLDSTRAGRLRSEGGWREMSVWISVFWVLQSGPHNLGEWVKTSGSP